ncbi:MAG: glycosyltransferase family 4 protein, partial [Anaerolineae bacterium]
IADRVVFTGYVPDEDLPALYSGADLFVFPSLYEGFGLPPLEAMACGTPVVCSKASSLPEVVGDAALMVDPYDVEALAEAMHRVLSDAVLREELRGKGLARAQQFTWEKAARETLAVYEEVLG